MKNKMKFERTQSLEKRVWNRKRIISKESDINRKGFKILPKIILLSHKNDLVVEIENEQMQ